VLCAEARLTTLIRRRGRGDVRGTGGGGCVRVDGTGDGYQVGGGGGGSALRAAFVRRGAASGPVPSVVCGVTQGGVFQLPGGGVTSRAVWHQGACSRVLLRRLSTVSLGGRDAVGGSEGRVGSPRGGSVGWGWGRFRRFPNSGHGPVDRVWCHVAGFLVWGVVVGGGRGGRYSGGWVYWGFVMDP